MERELYLMMQRKVVSPWLDRLQFLHMSPLLGSPPWDAPDSNDKSVQFRLFGYPKSNLNLLALPHSSQLRVLKLKINPFQV